MRDDLCDWVSLTFINAPSILICMMDGILRLRVPYATRIYCSGAIKDGTTTYARTHLDWQLDANNKNPRSIKY